MRLRTRPLIICAACLALGSSGAVASYLDEIGLTELRSRDSSLNGNGVTVAQIEASQGNAWQTDPAENCARRRANCRALARITRLIPDHRTCDTAQHRTRGRLLTRIRTRALATGKTQN